VMSLTFHTLETIKSFRAARSPSLGTPRTCCYPTPEKHRSLFKKPKRTGCEVIFIWIVRSLASNSAVFGINVALCSAATEGAELLIVQKLMQ
jgi:hypothetical protein